MSKSNSWWPGHPLEVIYNQQLDFFCDGDSGQYRLF